MPITRSQSGKSPEDSHPPNKRSRPSRDKNSEGARSSNRVRSGKSEISGDTESPGIGKTKKKRRVSTREEASSSTEEIKSTNTEVPPENVVQTEQAETWVPNTFDLRNRAPMLLRMLAELYRLRWDQQRNDRFKMIHWRKIAKFLEEECENPIISEEDVVNLSNCRGIGPSTVSILDEIRLTGYIDWMDDLLLEVQEIVEMRGNAERMISLQELQQKAQALGERNLEARARQRQRVVQRMGTDKKHGENVEAAMSKAVIVTGKQRRLLLDTLAEKGEEESPHEEKKVYLTRGVVQHEKVKKALHAVVKADSCAVCLEDYDDEDKLAVFDCEHCFHLDCIHHWLQSRMANGVQPSCPLCRRPIAKV